MSHDTSQVATALHPSELSLALKEAMKTVCMDPRHDALNALLDP